MVNELEWMSVRNSLKQGTLCFVNTKLLPKYFDNYALRNCDVHEHNTILTIRIN